MPKGFIAIDGTSLTVCNVNNVEHRIPDPPSVRTNRGAAHNSILGVAGQKTLKAMSLGPALASPSTLNTPLHTLSCTAFSIASPVDYIALKVPGPHAI